VQAAAVTVYGTSFANFSPFYKRVEEKGKKQRIKEKTVVQWINFFGIIILLTRHNHFSCVKNLEP